MPLSNNTVIGIDVGGARKGFHAVVLREGAVCGTKEACDPMVMAKWCREQKASVVGVDAPCMWSVAGGSRAVERELNHERIHCFYTPTRERAQGNPFYSWMLNGERLFDALLKHFSLFNGKRNVKQVCFETFPHAIVWNFYKGSVPTHTKKTIRREVLRKRGLDISTLSNIDFLDAALCAVAAEAFRCGEIKLYGDVKEGFVVVPSQGKFKSKK